MKETDIFAVFSLNGISIRLLLLGWDQCSPEVSNRYRQDHGCFSVVARKVSYQKKSVPGEDQHVSSTRVPVRVSLIPGSDELFVKKAGSQTHYLWVKKDVGDFYFHRNAPQNGMAVRRMDFINGCREAQKIGALTQ